MSIEYDKYLSMHRACVRHALTWILSRLPEDSLNKIYPKVNTTALTLQVEAHDLSKNSPKEYEAYDDFFYATNRTNEIKEAFDYAWLHHLHHNPHHWQYWVLKDDDGSKSSMKALKMPDDYVLEMIADWWSFSWKDYIVSHDKVDLYEIFTWYSEHKDSMLLHADTKKQVEATLDLIRDTLDDSDSWVSLI